MFVRLIRTILLCLLISCSSCDPSTTGSPNPPAEGFDLENSDPAAVELADSIMDAMGGRHHWDDTRFISWNFSGDRDLVWDKRDGKVRIESRADSTIYLIDLKTREGRVRVGARELTSSESLPKLLHRGRNIWIDDSYWLVMPFWLKESGITIKYMGEDTLLTGEKCNVLVLTSKGATETPKDWYRIYVDLRDNLVKEWEYDGVPTQDTLPLVRRPWDNYKRYGNILLSADRSDSSGPRNVRVTRTIPDNTFTDF